VAVMLLSACAEVPGSKSELYEADIIQLFSAGGPILYYPEGRNFAMFGQGSDYLEVSVDGQGYKLTDPYNNTYVIFGTRNQDGSMVFSEPQALLDKNTWTGLDNFEQFQAFFGDLGGNGLGDIYTMVLIKNEDMPRFVSPELWSGTKTMFCIWKYPGTTNILQNMNTNEIAQVNFVNTISDVHVYDTMSNGQCFSGYLQTNKKHEIYVSQSEPNTDQMNLAYEKAVELYGVDHVYDPIEACALWAYSMVDDNAVTKEQIEDWCGAYTPDMSDW
jgi:hypothetical protein